MEYTTIEWPKESVDINKIISHLQKDQFCMIHQCLCIIRQFVTQLTSLQINNTHIHTHLLCMYIHEDTNS